MLNYIKITQNKKIICTYSK